MSLFKLAEDGKIPANARPITEDKILSFYRKLFDEWQPKRELWAINNGPVILGVSSALTGIYVSNYFRRKLRLGRYGQFASYFPIIILPTILTAAFHQIVIQKEMLLNPTGCTICLHSKAALVQLGVGVIQPAILAPLSSLMFATRHFTYRIPSPIKNTSEFFKFFYKIGKPLTTPLTVAFGLQCVLSLIITHWEVETIHKVLLKILPENAVEVFGEETEMKDIAFKIAESRQ